MSRSNNSPQSSQENDEKSVMDSNVVDRVKKALDKNDRLSAVSAIKKYLEDINNCPLNIAVTGESGSGKSTFVNVFRGIDSRDEGAAPTGVVETTREPRSYPHPRYPNVTLWDLPGIGTTRFPAKKYLESVEFEKFDFFIILSADRFRENDAMLAQEIRKMDKKFYFVRSKIDNDLRAEKRSQRNYNEEKTLQQIREYCIKGLEAQGVESPQVFLCSQFDLHLYDFVKLQETMERELPSHKRDVLILALPNICKSNISKKKEVFRSQIKYSALISALAFWTVVNSYLLGFGLDDESLKKLSRKTNKPVEI
ncbi:hypothetical protein CRUP_028200 [Coryphaenoides rupestris]|nr:hypothetical protein CRUP_028200 [Coryphaenoides rupestris]